MSTVLESVQKRARRQWDSITGLKNEPQETNFSDVNAPIPLNLDGIGLIHENGLWHIGEPVESPLLTT